MRVGLLTREWPPDTYGGAGVHVEYLARELRRLLDLQVHCFGAERADATAHSPAAELAGANAALRTLSVDLAMTAALAGVDLVHSHTWYTNLAGHLAALLYGVPHVLTAHSLEPLRPWKAEQLGGGYALSAWAEATGYAGAAAVIAVSAGMRADVLRVYPQVAPERVHVVHNGIDTDHYRPDPSTAALVRHGIDPARPYVLFVGRIARQKGVGHLLRAAPLLPAEAQLVLCASAPDTPELGAEVAGAVAELQRQRSGVVWLAAPVPRDELVQLLTHATVFACPSVYEPMGIVNLEAMACQTAVVASAVGGIPEVVADGETGLLVPYDATRPEEFEAGLAAALGALLEDPARAARLGLAGRERAERLFSWPAVAERTAAVYRSVLG